MKFRIKSTTEKIESTAGIVLAGEIARFSGLNMDDRKYQLIPHRHILRSLFGLLVQGRTSFEEISLFRHDELFKRAFNLPFVPAQETLRIYLEKIAKSGQFVGNCLHEVNQNLLGKVKLSPVRAKSGNHYIPVDVDVSPFDNTGSKKEGVERTYKGCDGYSPIFSYIGAEGYMLDSELRKGKQHCQNGTPEFIQRNLDKVNALKVKEPVLFRLDGGNDAIATLEPLVKSGHFFLVKRNFRKEIPEQWLGIAKSLGEKHCPREGKSVYTGVMTTEHPKADLSLPSFDIVFTVTERISDSKGNRFLFPEIEVSTWWTNLCEDPESVIDLYHQHATSEQFHSELKTDMDVERLPSGKMGVNALILMVAMIAFNCLRLIGQKALELKKFLPIEPTTHRKRLRKVISDLIHIGCKYVKSGRNHILRVWEGNPWLPVFRELAAYFQSC